jgi:hypothetical protein
VLWRAFFAQFLASDTIGSEERLRVTIVGLIGFLLVPGLLLIVELFFDYQGIATPRVAAAVGSLVQFTFVLAVLGIVILSPAVWRVPHRALVNFTVTHALPMSWFLGVFEWITHAAFVGAVTTVMIEIAAPTIAFVPFTRAYRLGRAKRRTRWWLCVIGIYASTIWPVRFELWAPSRPAALLVEIAVLAGIAGALATAGRRQSIRLASSLRDDIADELAGFTVLDIGMAVHGASRT